MDSMTSAGQFPTYTMYRHSVYASRQYDDDSHCGIGCGSRRIRISMAFATKTDWNDGSRMDGDQQHRHEIQRPRRRAWRRVLLCLLSHIRVLITCCVDTLIMSGGHLATCKI